MKLDGWKSACTKIPTKTQIITMRTKLMHELGRTSRKLNS